MIACGHAPGLGRGDSGLQLHSQHAGIASVSASVNDAEEAPPGNIGIGGRCRSIIDHYVVHCPEASYEIFIDPYITSARRRSERPPV